MAGTAKGSKILAPKQFERRFTGLNITLSLPEKRFLDEVLKELKQYQISSKDRKNIKEQLLEHIQESREHGEDSLYELGDSTTFVRDFLEVNKVDLHTEIKRIRTSGNLKGILLLTGSVTFAAAYLVLQLVFSMFLTESFNPERTSGNFDYHILYRISDLPWWNAMLIMISLSAALLISIMATLYMRKTKINRGTTI
ncbi:hypothetical protein MNQ98_02655 [Paenibacillus sp. N3/727]|uniref:hypothetical protein n=1 Tax=Paenibacillus sp. N3/727 TaxID=2925845 RepID=UPI001F531E2C|nr:hypothetical protein [Paenibacillus sp. N3/727]UNK18967.1 hypothetical protein MNQ98_02655 [Paenibacillus sp. N3/727]